MADVPIKRVEVENLKRKSQPLKTKDKRVLTKSRVITGEMVQRLMAETAEKAGKSKNTTKKKIGQAQKELSGPVNPREVRSKGSKQLPVVVEEVEDEESSNDLEEYLDSEVEILEGIHLRTPHTPLQRQLFVVLTALSRTTRAQSLLSRNPQL